MNLVAAPVVLHHDDGRVAPRQCQGACSPHGCKFGCAYLLVQPAGLSIKPWPSERQAQLIEHQKALWSPIIQWRQGLRNDFIPDAVLSLPFCINRDQRFRHCAVFGLPQPNFGLLQQHARSSAAAAGCGKRMCATSPPPGATEKKLTFPRGRESRGEHASYFLMHAACFDFAEGMIEKIYNTCTIHRHHEHRFTRTTHTWVY